MTAIITRDIVKARYQILRLVRKKEPKTKMKYVQISRSLIFEICNVSKLLVQFGLLL